MTTNAILKQAYKITISYPVLWLVGVFLSSGFNFHFWYLWSWLEQNGLVSKLRIVLQQFDREVLIVIIVIGLLFGLVLVNYIKLIFLYLVHDLLHDSKLLICWLCNQKQQDKSFLQINVQKILGRTLLVSFITVVLSMLCIGLFNWYFANSYVSLPAIVVVFFCLLMLLVGVSLWSLFSIVSIFWYNMGFNHASKLAVSLLFMKMNRVFVVAFVVTVIFLISVMVGGIVIWQIPGFIENGNFFFFADSLTEALNIFANVAALISFFVWLTINNAWFNVAMVILYNDLVKPQKSESSIETLQQSRIVPSKI